MFSQCVWCKNFMPYGDKPWCLAFPDGIPNIIYRNDFIHDKHYAGDHGVMFEANENIPPKEKELYDYVKKAREKYE